MLLVARWRCRRVLDDETLLQLEALSESAVPKSVAKGLDARASADFAEHLASGMERK
jgi:hypothetical protein